MTTPPPPPPQAPPSKPWFKRWWAITLMALFVLGFLGSLGSDDAPPAPEASPEPEAEPELVEVPDLTGPYPEARELAEAVGVELRPLNDDGEYQAIFSPENWMVEDQSLDAGARVEAGTEVEVGVYRPSDRERERERATRAEERAQRDRERAQRDRERDAAEAEQIALVEQGYEWFGDEDGRVDIDVDYEVWRAQGAVSSIEGYRVIGNTFIVEVGLHPDNPETEGTARSLCGVASSSLYGTDARRVDVVALNGARLARCEVL